MAGIITKENPKHPAHPAYGKIAKEREAKIAADKKFADDAKKASEEKSTVKVPERKTE